MTVLENPPSPLNLHSPSPNVQHDSDYEDANEDKDEDESVEPPTLSETSQVECDDVSLKRLNGSSLVCKHMQLCQLKHVINIYGNRAFQ